MAEWYNKTSDFTDRDKQFLLLAYRNTLCNSAEGRQVLCHLKTMLEDTLDKSDAEIIAARQLLDAIFNNCGITDNMKIINALSGVASSFDIPKREEKDLLNVGDKQ